LSFFSNLHCAGGPAAGEHEEEQRGADRGEGGAQD